MKTFIFSILILGVITSCDTKKQSDKTNLEGSWILETLEKQAVSVDAQSEQPQLEFNLSENQFNGTNGCNNIFGNIEEVTDSKLILGNVASTLMACPDMNLPEKLSRALKETRSYKIEDNKLFLYGENDEELLQYSKKD